MKRSAQSRTTRRQTPRIRNTGITRKEAKAILLTKIKKFVRRLQSRGESPTVNEIAKKVGKSMRSTYALIEDCPDDFEITVAFGVNGGYFLIQGKGNYLIDVI